MRNLIQSTTSSSLNNLIYPVDLKNIFFNLFVESINLIEINIGFNGYYNLLINILKKENRRAFEKILFHMNRYNFMLNDILYELILDICDKYNYPSLIKNITDDLVINKNFILSGKNFIKYIHILSMFKETEDYVINLIDSSFTDFKLQIKSEFYEYLIFRNILVNDYNKIKTYMENLNKRYTSDYANEKIRNNEIYKGNVYLINSFIDIIVDYNKSNSSNIKNKINIDQDSLINKEEIYKLINDLINSSKECNNNWISDETFIKLTHKFYTDFSFNLDEFKNMIDDISRSTKSDIIFRDIINDGYRNISIKLLGFLKDNQEFLIRKSFNTISNLLKIHSSKILTENKEILLRDENIRRIFNFLRTNTSIEVKEAIKNYICAILEAKKFGNLNNLDLDSLRKLAYNVYGDHKQISNLFEDFKVDL